ncbi:unnamed protein product, partial [Arabidopsis halleri]
QKIILPNGTACISRAKSFSPKSLAESSSLLPICSPLRCFGFDRRRERAHLSLLFRCSVTGAWVFRRLIDLRLKLTVFGRRSAVRDGHPVVCWCFSVQLSSLVDGVRSGGVTVPSFASRSRPAKIFF